MQERGDDLRAYYARRAREYERIYAKPERQSDLQTLRETLPSLLAGRTVLEVACGTGYWTQPVSARARAVLATDVNEEVLELARQKNYPRANVTFEPADAYLLPADSGDLDAGFAAFWWSHIPKARLQDFLHRFHSKLKPDAVVVFIDNCYVKGSSTPISRTDPSGNTYQHRVLGNGARYEVMKNFPRERELREVLDRVSEGFEYHRLDYYWYAQYRVKR
jgi:demethylmenaquinone methyltransferase/2-methoxy-6-polyprenyl-1,4-benzoquinol methylase